MPYYRSLPVVIEARQFTEESAQDIYSWILENTLGPFMPMEVINGKVPWPESGVSIDPRDGRMIIATLGGGHWVDLNDYVICGTFKEFYPCKPHIFEGKYEFVTN